MYVYVQHTTDYESLLGLCGVTEFKMLLSGILPSYFKYFPSLQEKALNCQLVCLYVLVPGW